MLSDKDADHTLPRPHPHPPPFKPSNLSPQPPGILASRQRLSLMLSGTEGDHPLSPSAAPVPRHSRDGGSASISGGGAGGGSSGNGGGSGGPSSDGSTRRSTRSNDGQLATAGQCAGQTCSRRSTGESLGFKEGSLNTMPLPGATVPPLSLQQLGGAWGEGGAAGGSSSEGLTGGLTAGGGSSRRLTALTRPRTDTAGEDGGRGGGGEGKEWGEGEGVANMGGGGSAAAEGVKAGGWSVTVLPGALPFVELAH